MAKYLQQISYQTKNRWNIDYTKFEKLDTCAVYWYFFEIQSWHRDLLFQHKLWV